MASPIEPNTPTAQGSSSGESSFSPSPLDTSTMPRSPPRQLSPQVKVEAGEDATQVPSPAAEHPTAGGVLLMSSVPAAPIGTALSTPSNILETTSGVDRDVSVLTNGVVPQRIDAVSPSASSTDTKSAVAKPDSPVPKSENEVPQHAFPVSNDLHEPSKAMPQDNAPVTLSRARLPQDRLGLLSDRITDDPRGDVGAWLALIQEHKSHHRLDDARDTYEAFFKVFPLATEQWKAYADMELDNDNFAKAEKIFARTVQEIPSLTLCTAYLDYVRRRHSIATDAGRNVVSASFKLVLGIVGKDKGAGPLWQDYIGFLRSAQGSVTGSSWQDQQKKDVLRAAYHEAVSIPHSATRILWSDYNKFEREVDRNKVQTMLRVKSEDYTQADLARQRLKTFSSELDPSTIPRLPPAFGFAGDLEYTKQVDTWKRLIEWEKTDPMVFKKDQPGEWRGRVLYAYKQAIVPLFFWPEIWFSAADFCLSEGLTAEADRFLTRGTAANPESCLLAFQRADRIESSSEDNGTDEGKKQRGDTVRKPYDDNLNALYHLITKTKEREKQIFERVRSEFEKQEQEASGSRPVSRAEDDDEDTGVNKIDDNKASASEARLAHLIQMVERSTQTQINILKKTVTFVWTALMRAMRRVQGKGMPSGTVRGVRGIFADARKRGQLTSDFYTANALIEHYCFEDVVGTKIFERGWKLFPDDAEYAISYIKHLLEIRDTTNARATFEIMISTARLGKTPELIASAKPLFAFWHRHESQYGALPQLKKLEQRMRETYPEDPDLTLFARRHSVPGFDPCAIRPLISQRAQMTPKPLSTMDPQHFTSMVTSPMPRPLPAISNATDSPKRPFEESDSESGPPRKLIRVDSPILKGAAGRRLDAAKNKSLGRSEHNHPGGSTQPAGTPRKHPIPQPIYRLLHSLPPAHAARNIPRVADDVLLHLLRLSDLSKENMDRLIAAHPNGLPKMPQPGLPNVPALQPALQPAPTQQNYGQQGGYGQPSYSQYPNTSFGYGQPGGQAAPYGYGR